MIKLQPKVMTKDNNNGLVNIHWVTVNYLLWATYYGVLWAVIAYKRMLRAVRPGRSISWKFLIKAYVEPSVPWFR